MASALSQALADSSALDAGSWTDILGAAIAILLGASGIVAWIFSKRARARSSLRRLGVEVSDASLARCVVDDDPKAVRLLLRAGVRADVRVNGRTPLQAAVESGDRRMVDLLVRHAPHDAIAQELVRGHATAPTAEPGPGFTVLDSVQEVLDHIQQVIATDVSPAERTEVRNLGLDLEVVQTFLLYRLIFQKNLQNLDYRGMLIDGEAERIRPIVDGGSSIHTGTAAAVVEKVGNQIAENANFLERNNISIEIRSYDLPPVLHGFLVDNRHLYIGFTEFSHGKLHGGEFSYLYLDRKKTDPMTAHLFRVYRSWFDYHWQQGKSLCSS
ncbi:hypothetical protein ACIQUM_16235 [Amycolatopsis azurea]|uniref:hypothetical protein n=1 Tax=Amycolatopsis azurea TaxID=36819 RepID=UPI00381A7141